MKKIDAYDFLLIVLAALALVILWAGQSDQNFETLAHVFPWLNP